MSPEISIVRCVGYQPGLVQEKVKQAVDFLGGMSNFVRPESRVLLKPNLLMAKEPEFGIDTHPEVVRAVIKILKELNCEIFVGDGPSVWGRQPEDVNEVYRRSGIKGVCEEEGVNLVKFENKRWRKKFPLTTWLDNCDYLINLPKFKTHSMTLLTGAVKNLYGLVWGSYKTELHKNYFAINDFTRMLVDLYEEVRPALTIVDAIIAMEGDGPATGGKLRQENLLIASSDCVAIDSVLAKIMGLEPFDVLTTKEAAARGLGAGEIDKINIKGEKLNDLSCRPFILPVSSPVLRIPRPLLEIVKKFIRYYPYVEQTNCIKCSACVDACPHKIISLKQKGIAFDYPGCIACFCCQEACPASAIKIKKSLLAKLAGL